MTKTKRIMAVLLAVFLLAALAVVPASAAYVTSGGKIIVENAQISTYSAYKILDMEVNPTTGAYRYKLTSDNWKNFINANTSYFEVTADGYVTVKYDGATAALVAKAAADFAAEPANGISTPFTKTFATGGDLELATDADCGYYLLTSKVGDLCALGTMLPVASGAPSITLREKNSAGGLPTIEKTIDGVTQSFGIGDTVNFTITVTTEEDGQDYVVHDTMTGLELTDPHNITVNYNGNPLDASKYTIKTSGTCGCTFEVAIDNSVDMKAYDEITISYSAVVTGLNPVNEAELTSQGNPPVEPPGPGVSPYLCTFKVQKTDGTNNLAGAQFELYEGGNKINVVLDGGVYRPAKTGETPVTITTDATDVLTFGGFGPGDYVLRETVAPAGYIRYTNDITINLSASDSDSDGKKDTTNVGFVGTAPDASDVVIVDDAVDTVKVINKTGSILPETGGVGTTIFYVAGLVLVLCAAAVLVSKKRANA